MEATIKSVRKIGIIIAGLSLLALGVVMLVLPGPGVLFIIAGLTVLAKQFRWAEIMLTRVKYWVASFMTSLRRALGDKHGALVKRA
ncbi:MAG: PGPGW domain-containing protein [Myxococcota bacterium]|nr:PGPGW domain-containing protein [Myxococcota bacterium]